MTRRPLAERAHEQLHKLPGMPEHSEGTRLNRQGGLPSPAAPEPPAEEPADQPRPQGAEGARRLAGRHRPLLLPAGQVAVAASPAISVSGLTKAYSQTTGIFDVDLDVPGETVMALLGPNGAGKTTALRILSTLLRPDRGTVRVGGIDALTQPDRVQALIGVANQASAVDENSAGG